MSVVRLAHLVALQVSPGLEALEARLYLDGRLLHLGVGQVDVYFLLVLLHFLVIPVGGRERFSGSCGMHREGEMVGPSREA